MLTAEGFDEAILGVTRCKGRPDVVCYDYDKCVHILMERDGMSEQQAVEYLEFNVLDADVGPGTPAFLMKADLEEIEMWDPVNESI